MTLRIKNLPTRPPDDTSQPEFTRASGHTLWNCCAVIGFILCLLALVLPPYPLWFSLIHLFGAAFWAWQLRQIWHNRTPDYSKTEIRNERLAHWVNKPALTPPPPPINWLQFERYVEQGLQKDPFAEIDKEWIMGKLESGICPHDWKSTKTFDKEGNEHRKSTCRLCEKVVTGTGFSSAPVTMHETFDIDQGGNIMTVEENFAAIQNRLNSVIAVPEHAVGALHGQCVHTSVKWLGSGVWKCSECGEKYYGDHNANPFAKR